MTKEEKEKLCQITVHRDYLSRKDLRAMAAGQTIEFVLPDNKLESARTTCDHMRLYGMKFKCPFYRDGYTSVVVTRIE